MKPGLKNETDSGGRLTRWVPLLLIGFVYLYLKSFGIHPTATGDENAYFYMARLMAEGKLFYRDFFFAHPPVQLLLLTGIFKLFGYNFILLKISAFLPVLLGAGVLYFEAWKRRGALAAWLFLGIFLFGYESLKITTHPFGLNLTACFLMLSFHSFLRDRAGACGFWAGLGGLTGFYAAPWALIPIGYYLFVLRSGKNLRAYLFWLGVIFLGGNGLFVLCLGDNYLTPVFHYHFLKPPGMDSVFDIYIRVLRRNPLPFLIPALALLVSGNSKSRIGLWAGGIYCIFLARLNPLFTQYFMLPLPFLSFSSSELLVEWLNHFKFRVEKRWAGLMVLLVVGGVAIYSGWAALVHEKISGFSNLIPAVEFIKNNSDPDDLLFGQVTVTPLLALETGRGIALDMVDTNHMRFQAGLADLDEVVKALRRESKLKYMIITETRLWLSPEIQEFLQRGKLVRVFQEPRDRILVYDLKVEP